MRFWSHKYTPPKAGLFLLVYNQYMKKIIIFLVITALFILYFIFAKDPAEEPVATPETNSINLCFYKEEVTPSGFSDEAWLRMNLLGEEVSGEFYNLPAEKDSKVGSFEGSVGAVDPYAMARTADVWWEAEAEGFVVTEQLKIVFGEGTASIGFGEMVDRGDGVYVYKDESNITYWQELYDVSCDDLAERLLVEDYIRDNIGILVTEEPVLGGSWYFVSMTLDPFEKTGQVVYEDGHIQGTTDFRYERNGEEVKIISIEEVSE